MRVVKTYLGEIHVFGEDTEEVTAAFHPPNHITGQGPTTIAAMEQLASELRSVADAIIFNSRRR